MNIDEAIKRMESAEPSTVVVIGDVGSGIHRVQEALFNHFQNDLNMDYLTFGRDGGNENCSTAETVVVSNLGQLAGGDRSRRLVDIHCRIETNRKKFLVLSYPETAIPCHDMEYIYDMIRSVSVVRDITVILITSRLDWIDYTNDFDSFALYGVKYDTDKKEVVIGEARVENLERWLNRDETLQELWDQNRLIEVAMRG